MAIKELRRAGLGMWIVGALSACSGQESDTELACGEPILHDGIRVQVTAVTARAPGQPMTGATIILYDARTDPPTKLGSQATADRGEFDFTADGVTDIPGCWAQLSYTLNGYGNEAVVLDVTGLLEVAIRDGTALVIEDPMML